MGQGVRGPGSPPIPRDGVTYHQSLCASPINHLLHACLWSASSLPHARVRAAPAAGHWLILLPQGTGEQGWVPWAAPGAPSPAMGSRGAQEAPSFGGCKTAAHGRAHWVAASPQGEGFRQPHVGLAALWGAPRSPTLWWGVPPPWCKPTVPQNLSPRPSCRSSPTSSPLSPREGGVGVGGPQKQNRQRRGDSPGVGTALSRSGHSGAGKSSALLALAPGHGEGRSSPSTPPPPRQCEFRHEK